MIACKVENGSPASHFFMYTFRFEEGVYPNAKLRYLPRPCMHCEDPPCVAACTSDARIKWKDGFVLTDIDNCMGVRGCQNACPYGVNYFNVDDPARNQYLDWQNEDIRGILGGMDPSWNPELEAAQSWDQEPNKKERRLAGAGHRRNTTGKCTFCVHRIEAGKSDTACENACPMRAIVFGDLDDPSSAVSQAIKEAGNAVFRLKTSAGTNPKVFYLGEPPRRDARLVEKVPVKEGVQAHGSPDNAGGTVPWK
jgi:molybdopterin-containing oxidoreductase family iron-sulfur binding subunit